MLHAYKAYSSRSIACILHVYILSSPGMFCNKLLLALEVYNRNNPHTPTLHSRETGCKGRPRTNTHRSWVEGDSTQFGGVFVNYEAWANYQEDPVVFTMKRTSILGKGKRKWARVLLTDFWGLDSIYLWGLQSSSKKKK